MDSRKINIQRAIYDENDRIAKALNERFSAQGNFVLNIMGAPGAGKTSVIRCVAEKIGMPCAVIEGDIESDIDTQKLTALGIPTYQINTHGACHLDAPTLGGAVDSFNPPPGSMVLIENIGNLVCPAEFSIGEHLKMLVVTVTDGSDKPYKYPLAFEKAGLIVLNKVDLLPFVDFDLDYFLAGVRALNPDAPVFQVSAREGGGIDQVVTWIQDARQMIGV